MKPRYAIGETVRIKATGEKVKIREIHRTLNGLEHICGNWSYLESELKPFCPSRMNGKIRDEKGRLRSKKSICNCWLCKEIENQLHQEPPILCAQCNKTSDKCNCSLLRKSMTPTPEKIEKIMVDMLMTPTDWKQTIAINQLLDAHYALEERVGRLEKNQYPDTKPFPEYRVRENDICMKCGKAKFGNIFHECTSPKA